MGIQILFSTFQIRILTTIFIKIISNTFQKYFYFILNTFKFYQFYIPDFDKNESYCMYREQMFLNYLSFISYGITELSFGTIKNLSRIQITVNL